MLNQNDLIKKVKVYNKFFNRDILTKAYNYALNAHKYQKRVAGEPYIIHPVAVADILTELKIIYPPQTASENNANITAT